MKEQFVPYNLALKLKELGFDEMCIAFYNEKTELRLVSQKSHKISMRIMRNRSLRNEAKCTAPLWQQAFDWMLDKVNPNINDGRYSIEKDNVFDRLLFYECKTIGDVKKWKEAKVITLNKESSLDYLINKLK